MQTSSRHPGRTISPPHRMVAAAAAAAVSTLAVQPLDVLKTRLQVWSLMPYNTNPMQGITSNLKNILVSEGIRGLYRGTVPSLISVVPSIAIYFTLYNEFKKGLNAESGSPLRTTSLQSVAAGLASCCTSAVTNPLWVIKTRLQTQPHSPLQNPKYRNSLDALKAIRREEGIRGLYKGLGASFMHCSQAMIQFPIYEKIKHALCSKYQQDTAGAAACSLVSSSVAALIACSITYPAEVVRCRMQVQGMRLEHIEAVAARLSNPPVSSNGTLHAFRTIWYQEGMRGLYRGMATNLVRMVPAQAISFTVYETILHTLSGFRSVNFPPGVGGL